MPHLEDLLCQYYDWQGYVVRRNVKVGRLGHGGWEGELDIVAYHPTSQDLLHLEPSIDALSWNKRRERFDKKFRSGRKFIFTEVFPWLSRETPLTQIAVLISRSADHATIGSGTVVTIDEITKQIREKVTARGKMATSAIPEQYDLLRTVQLTESGYYRRLS